MKNTSSQPHQIQNFSFMNHVNKIQLGDSLAIDQHFDPIIQNTQSNYSSSPMDEVNQIFSAEKDEPYSLTQQQQQQHNQHQIHLQNLDNIKVANFLKDNKKVNGNMYINEEFELPANPLHHKKVFQNSLKNNSSIMENNSQYNHKAAAAVMREEPIINYNSNKSNSNIQQNEYIDKSKMCQNHPTKIVKYHLIDNPAIQFCSKCALEYAVSGVKIEKRDCTKDKKFEQEKISMKNSQQSKDSSLFTITKNTQPDTLQTQYTEMGCPEESVDENYKNDKLRVFLERVGYTNDFLKQTEECIVRKLEESQRYFEMEEKKVMDTFYDIIQSIENEKNEILMLTKHSSEENSGILLKNLENIRRQQNEINQFSEDISINIQNIIYQMEKQPFDDIIDRYNLRISSINSFTNQLSSQPISLFELEQNFENLKVIKAKIFPNLLTIKQNSVSFREFLNYALISTDSFKNECHNNSMINYTQQQQPKIDSDKFSSQQTQQDSSFYLESRPKISSTKNIKQKVMSPYQNSTKSNNSRVSNVKMVHQKTMNRSYDGGHRTDSSFQLNTSINLNSSGLNLLNTKSNQFQQLNNSFSHGTSSSLNTANSRSRSVNCQKPNIFSAQNQNIFSNTQQYGTSTTSSQANQYFQKVHSDSMENQQDRSNQKLKYIQNESIMKHIQRFQNKDKKPSNQSSLNPSRRASKHQYLTSQQESYHENYGKSTNEFINEEESIKAQVNNTSFENSFTGNLGPERIQIGNPPTSKYFGHRQNYQNKSTNNHINPVFNQSLSSMSNQYNHSTYNNNNNNNKSQNQNFSNVSNINFPNNHSNSINNNSVYTSVLKTMKGKLYTQNGNPHQQNQQRHNTSNNNNYRQSQNNSCNNSHFNSMNTDFNDVNPHNISINNKENLTINLNAMY